MGKNKKSTGGIVYSTNPDFHLQDESVSNEESLSPSAQDLRIWLERKGGGKMVSVIKGFKGTGDALDELAKILKSRCGVGGSAKDNEILIQGDHRDKIERILKELGYRARKAGG